MSEIASSTSDYGSGLFTAVLPVVGMILGLFVAAILLSKVGRWVLGAVKTAIGKRSSRRRGRR